MSCDLRDREFQRYSVRTSLFVSFVFLAPAPKMVMLSKTQNPFLEAGIPEGEAGHMCVDHLLAVKPGPRLDCWIAK